MSVYRRRESRSHKRMSERDARKTNMRNIPKRNFRGGTAL